MKGDFIVALTPHRKIDTAGARLESAQNDAVEKDRQLRIAKPDHVRERVPLDWAESFGSQGFCMMLIADRTNDPALAANAVEQIEAAYETVRDGQTPWAAYYAKLLPLARKTRDRLNGK